MTRFAILGAVGATVIALAGCMPGEEVITKAEADVKLEVTATDDSGDSTTYSEVITRGGVSDCTNAGL